NGGVAAWLQVLACLLIAMNNWGLAASFGIFEAYFQLPTSKPNLIGHSASSISWIGTTQSAVTLILGCLSGPLFDRGHACRILLVTSLSMTVVLFSVSWCHTYLQLFVVQGFLQGVCSGFLYVPAIALIPQWFSTHRGLAVGIVSAGGPIGGIIYPLVLRRLLLIDAMSFAWATRIVALVSLSTLFIANLIFKPLIVTNRALKRTAASKEIVTLPFALLVAAFFFLFCGVMTPYILSPTYSFNVIKVYAAKSEAFNTVAVLNTGNFFGRILFSSLSDFGIPVKHILGGVNLMLIALAFIWIKITTRAPFTAFLFFYGFFSGGIGALPAACLLDYCPTLDIFASMLGIVFMSAGIGILIGTPTAAAIAE
ncbi:MFS general substrate transporter, partial [Myriangium duriaei CBS 260.36]